MGGVTKEKPSRSWSQWMVATAKDWRVRADRIESMFSSKKDKPPTISTMGNKNMCILLVLGLVLVACSLYAIGFPNVPSKLAWGGGGGSAEHKKPVSQLADLLGSQSGETLVAELNQRFSKLSVPDQPEAVMRWASEVVPSNRWCQVTSFGPSGLVALHLLSKMGSIPHGYIATVDTLHLFPETYELIRTVKKRFGLEDHLRVYRASNLKTREEFEAKYGAHLWRADPHLFDFLTKVDPMRRALDDLDTLVWITGRRKSQGGERKSMPIVEIDPSDGRVKLNPLANWGKEEVWEYIRRNKIPYNELHDKGYASVGDVVTTVKTAPGSSEREGRFKGQNKTECGMHVAVSGDSLQQMLQRAAIIEKGYKWEGEERAKCEMVGIQQATQENFKELVVDSPDNVLLEVYAPWCGHCQHYAPVYREVAENILSSIVQGGITVSRMDGYQNKVPPEEAAAYPVKGFPTIFLAKSGAKRTPLIYSGQRHEVDDVVKWVLQETGRAE